MDVTTITPIKIVRINGELSRSLDRINYHLNSFEQEIDKLVVDCSEPDIAKNIEEICKNLGIRYIYLETDLVWNKALCLNIGILASPEAKYIATLDVDCIYRSEILKECVEISEKLDCVITLFGTMSGKQLFDPENINFKELKNKYSTRDIKLGNGGFQFYKAAWLRKVRGFDEYYNLWGKTDKEILKRASAQGLKIITLGAEDICFAHMNHVYRHSVLPFRDTIAYCNTINNALFKFENKEVNSESWGKEEKVLGPRKTNKIFKFGNKEETINFYNYDKIIDRLTLGIKTEDILDIDESNPPYQSFSGLKGQRNVRKRTSLLGLPKSLEGKTVLDLGCDLGYNCIEAKKRGASEVVGLDIREDVIKVAKSLKQGIRYEVFDISSGLESLKELLGLEPFNYVFALSIWNHIERESLKDIIRFYTKDWCWFEGHPGQSKEKFERIFNGEFKVSKHSYLGNDNNQVSFKLWV